MLRKVRACVCLVDLLFNFAPERDSKPFSFILVSFPRALPDLLLLFVFRPQDLNFAPKRASEPSPFILISPPSALTGLFLIF